MIVPTLSDIVYTISAGLDEIITPKLEGLRERSTMTTIRHMLRFVEHAIDNEGQLLFDDLKKLKPLLADIAQRFESVAELKGVASAIRQSLASERDPNVYPSIKLLAEEIRRLRQHVSDALVALRALPATARGPQTEAAHQLLRDYIKWQLKQEARVIEPAFIGYGARR
ncbi:MAG: hypothetical protein ABW110_02355 [Steroidobacteraceae bacterium]